MNEFVLLQLVGVFGPIIALASSPFIALTVLSGMGWLLNAEVIPAEWIPLAEPLMNLPISNLYFFIFMLVVVGIKYALGTTAASNLFNEATLKRVETFVGVFVCTVGTYMVTRDITTTEALRAAGTDAAFTFARQGGLMAAQHVVSVGVSVAFAVIAFVKAGIVGLVNDALDAFAGMFLVFVPGGTFLYTNFRFVTVIGLTLIALFAPWIAAIFAGIIFIISVILARPAYRLQRYYKNIYAKPVFNFLFKTYKPSLLPKKMPRAVAEEFSNPSICIEAYSAGGIYELPHSSSDSVYYVFKKRERCWFVREGDTNYIFVKRFLHAPRRLEITSPLCVEKCFRFVKIFTDWHLPDKQRGINLIIRREHAFNIPELTAFGVFDVNRDVEAFPNDVHPC
ncbi:MAG: hypothetical protein FWC70_05065 [Defluviitaleaceae bacterium]|nr:hypothetical protein [Defluviitaleaceae bacterium]